MGEVHFIQCDVCPDRTELNEGEKAGDRWATIQGAAIVEGKRRTLNIPRDLCPRCSHMLVTFLRDLKATHDHANDAVKSLTTIEKLPVLAACVLHNKPGCTEPACFVQICK